MPLKVKLRDLHDDSVHLRGELAVGKLDIDPLDEVIRLTDPLEYDLEVQSMDEGLLVQGQWAIELDCQCVRCLKPFKHKIFSNEWSRLIPLRGEDAAPVSNEVVDLTPYLRDDILLEFPQHPLCDPGCGGLPGVRDKQPETHSSDQTEPSSTSAWAELNKLKL
jgi:uncharacterized protein